MGKKKEVTVGYRYFLGVHFVLCHGHVDYLTAITVDERLAWSGTCADGGLMITNDDLFGGEKREGGIAGYVSFMPGSATQGQNGYLASKLGWDVPAYRRVASVVLHQVYMGTNPYMKKWAFRLTRMFRKSDGSAQWYSGKVAIGQDMNPAHIIRECLTDNDWGMGYLDSDVDEASFIAAADRLYSENFGLSILWDRQAAISDFITEVLRHIDASLYVSKTTGKFTIYLIRDDYNVDNLLTLDENSIARVEEFKCSTFTELSNSVTVNYWEAATGRNSSLTVQDIAMVQLQGSTISSTMEYGGCTNGDLATRLASRDLRALSTPITRCTVMATRLAADVIPGQPIKLTWPDYGVSNLVMRVAAIDFGTATENTVKLTLIQDVFSIGTATYAAPPSTEWVSLHTDPQPVVDRITMEAPYYTLVKMVGEDEVNSKLSGSNALGFVMSAGARPTGDSLNATMWSDGGAGYAGDTTLDFCAMGVSSGVILPMATVIPLSSSRDFYADMVAIGSYAAINSELVEIMNYSDTSLTVRRGVLDTVPTQHAAGSKIFMLGTLNGVGTTEWAAGETVNVKLTPTAGRGVLPLSSAPASSVTLNRRAFRPYPPGGWSINGSYFPASIIDQPISMTWAHRNRLQQTGSNLVDFTEGSLTPEVGTTYSIRLYNADTSGLLHSVDGVTTSAYAAFPTMSGMYNLRLELWSVRDGYSSLFKHSHTFYYENIYRLFAEDSTGNILTETGDILITE